MKQCRHEVKPLQAFGGAAPKGTCLGAQPPSCREFGGAPLGLAAFRDSWRLAGSTSLGKAKFKKTRCVLFKGWLIWSKRHGSERHALLWVGPRSFLGLDRWDNLLTVMFKLHTQATLFRAYVHVYIYIGYGLPWVTLHDLSKHMKLSFWW